jgi:hypothetical protein
MLIQDQKDIHFNVWQCKNELCFHSDNGQNLNPTVKHGDQAPTAQQTHIQSLPPPQKYHFDASAEKISITIFAALQWKCLHHINQHHDIH